MRSDENPAYADVRKRANNRPSATNPGDPTATREPILKVVDAEELPLRVFFGKAPLGIATKGYESRLAKWNAWQPVSLQMQGGPDAYADGLPGRVSFASHQPAPRRRSPRSLGSWRGPGVRVNASKSGQVGLPLAQS